MSLCPSSFPLLQGLVAVLRLLYVQNPLSQEAKGEQNSPAFLSGVTWLLLMALLDILNSTAPLRGTACLHLSIKLLTTALLDATCQPICCVLGNVLNKPTFLQPREQAVVRGCGKGFTEVCISLADYRYCSQIQQNFTWLSSTPVFRNVLISYEKPLLVTVKNWFLLIAIKATERSDDRKVFNNYLGLF